MIIWPLDYSFKTEFFIYKCDFCDHAATPQAVAQMDATHGRYYNGKSERNLYACHYCIIYNNWHHRRAFQAGSVP